MRKLGIREGDRVTVLSAPPGFALEWPAGVAVTRRLPAKTDVVLFFTKSRDQLGRQIDRLGQAVAPDGTIWVAWPKRASKVATDMTEDVVREVALPVGLVDNKVCAIDEVWSGLKLVWRKELRTPTSPGG